MSEPNPHPLVQQFIQDCDAADIEPLDVARAAGVSRSTWFRWKAGSFAPSMGRWDAVQHALLKAKQGIAA